MKLKTRLGIAWFELVFVTLVLAAAIYVDLVRPHGPMSLAGLLVGLAAPVLILVPMCLSSWKRLRLTRAQLAKLGPDAAPSADLWTAPGMPGVVGIAIVVAAVAVALIPGLLLRP